MVKLTTKSSKRHQPVILFHLKIKNSDIGTDILDNYQFMRRKGELDVFFV